MILKISFIHNTDLSLDHNSNSRLGHTWDRGHHCSRSLSALMICFIQFSDSLCLHFLLQQDQHVFTSAVSWSTSIKLSWSNKVIIFSYYYQTSSNECQSITFHTLLFRLVVYNYKTSQSLIIMCCWRRYLVWFITKYSLAAWDLHST